MKPITIGTIGDAGVPLQLDLDRVRQSRLLVNGGSGSGKSWLVRRIAEQACGQLPVIIIDPEGEFSTLRAKYNFVLIGQGGETPADVRSAGLVAHKLLELRASAVCDLFEMKAEDRHTWVRDFLTALIDAPKKLWQPMLIIVDEAHMFAPEKGEPPSVALEAMMNLASRGRKRGFALVVATQRLAKLNNNVLAELQNVLVGLATLEADQDRAVRVLGMVKSRETRQFAADLARLETSQFWAFGRALTMQREIVNVGGVNTPHPREGDTKHAAAPPPAPEEVKAMMAKLADLPKQAEAKALTEKELRRELADKDRQIRELQRGTSGFSPSNEGKKVEVPALTDADRALITRLLIDLEAHASRFITKEMDVRAMLRAEVDEAVEGAGQRIETMLLIGRKDFEDRLAKAGFTKILEKIGRVALAPAGGSTMPPKGGKPATHLPQTPRRNITHSRIPGTRESAPTGEGKLPAGERSVLIATAQCPDGADRTQLSILTGYKRSTRDRYIQFLQQKGFVQVSRDRVMATEAGISALGDFEPLPTGDRLRAYWMAKLPEGERAVLAAVVEAWPSAQHRDDIDAITGYKRSTRDRYIQFLQARRLVTSDRDGVKASAELFS